ncbi:DNA repair protein [Pedobacter sp. G11]|uniref:JAB domain-containing protein n=1 Tax=Pedobacter sp. G11 TaxID=2482728 RepID=UPI000F603000|nr:JAB domain-containing protein [Pedobacter sp. G11]AZI26634.1 DNA repair protein [Pedobacter sp. G11]
MENYHVHQKQLSTICEIEITYHPDFRISDCPKADSSEDLYSILREHWNLNQIALREEFKIILLSTNLRILGISSIASGGMSAVSIDSKLIFSTALLANARGIVLAHNHPSGNLIPSQSDINITKKIKDGAKLLDIEVFDHIILTKDNGYYSFADDGIL